MHITVRTDKGKAIRLRIPTRLLLNGFTAAIAASILKRNAVLLPKKQFLAFFSCIHSFKSQHPDWILVDADTADGKKVCIKL